MLESVLFQVPLEATYCCSLKIGLKVSDWSGWLVRSKDGGKHGVSVNPLPEGFLGPIKNKPEFVNGRIICPVEHGRQWRLAGSL